jgi:hypothetical protein
MQMDKKSKGNLLDPLSFFWQRNAKKAYHFIPCLYTSYLFYTRTNAFHVNSLTFLSKGLMFLNTFCLSTQQLTSRVSGKFFGVFSCNGFYIKKARRLDRYVTQRGMLQRIYGDR